MAGTINTSAVLNNGWNSGGNDQVFTGTIAVNPSVEKNYDFALTTDPVMLQEKMKTQENLYEIFSKSPYFQKYGGTVSDSSTPYPKKVEKNEIIPVFYYMKEELEKKQQLSISEIVIQICEFFEFDYKYVYTTVLSAPLQLKLMQELYDLGYKKEQIENTESLF